MTSSDRSKPSLVKSESDDSCEKCGGPLTWRQAHPHPVARQILFGVSFIVFLLVSDRLKEHRQILYAWSIVQAGLGIWLIRGRIAAKKRILRCIRCSATLR